MNAELIALQAEVDRLEAHEAMSIKPPDPPRSVSQREARIAVEFIEDLEGIYIRYKTLPDSPEKETLKERLKTLAAHMRALIGPPPTSSRLP